MKPMDNRSAGNLNLLLLADILDDADEEHAINGEPPYDQTRWFHTNYQCVPCRSPACAIGHWLAYHGYRAMGVSPEKLKQLAADFDFDMTSERDQKAWKRLFGYESGALRTAAEEAVLIREFVAARTVHV